MTKTIERIQDAGLIVVRGAIDPSLSRRVAQELAHFMSPEVFFAKDKHKVISRDHDLSFLTTTPYFRKTNIVKDLLINGGNQNAFTVNYQPPDSEQLMHVDDTTDPVVVFHASDGGCFDYISKVGEINHDDQKIESIPVNAGDIVIQSLHDQLHRGSNPSDVPRITVAFWNADNVERIIDMSAM